MAKPIKKQRAYKRPAAHAKTLKEVTALSQPEVLKRISIRGHNSPGHIATEVLITIFRQATDQGQIPVEPIWQEVNRRIIQTAKSFLRKNSGAIQSRVSEDQAEELAGKMVLALVNGYQHMVSFAEVNFGTFAKRIGISHIREQAALKRAEERRFTDLEAPASEEEDGETGSLDPAEALAYLFKDNQSDSPLIAPERDYPTTKVLNAQVRRLMRERLTEEENTAIVYHYLMDMPIESDNPKELTVSKFMGKSSRMVRIYIARGMAKLKQE